VDKHWRERVEPFFEELLPEFEENLLRESAQLAGLLESGALEDLGRIAHKIKGSAGYFNLTELGQLARTLEMQCKAGDRAAAAASIETWQALVGKLELRSV